MAKDALSGVAKTRSTTSAPMVPTKPPPPPSGAVKLVKKATERLEEDAKEMEDRLAQLRLSMLEEKQKRDRELPAKHGGSRWRSAREDRGSVSNYAQDVQSGKTKPGTAKKASGGGAGAETKVKKKSTKTSKRGSNEVTQGGHLGILSVATVSSWTTGQVLEWLSTIGLDECQSGFEYHQVTGATLLELTMDELTQMGVAKLSVRNALCAEIESIRAKGSSGFQQQGVADSLTRHQPAAEIIDAKLRDVGPEVHSPQSKRAADNGVHWSQLKPLSETTVALGNGEVPVNLADGDFNEDESHASFMKALLEWRATDSEQQDSAGDVAVFGGGDGNEKEELWVNPMMAMFGANEQEEDLPPGGALLSGFYDEAKEQEAFRRAVEAWRSDSSSTTETAAKASSSPNVEQIEQGCTAAQRKSCWQCYQVANVDSLIVDEQTKKPFCSAACQSVYRQEYSRFYPSSILQ